MYCATKQTRAHSFRRQCVPAPEFLHILLPAGSWHRLLEGAAEYPDSMGPTSSISILVDIVC